MKAFLLIWQRISLVKKIIMGLILGSLLAVFLPAQTAFLGIFGNLFVKALKGVAPILVLFLVTSALARHKKGEKTNMKTVIGLYLVGTFLAGFIAVVMSFIFPVELSLVTSASSVSPPEGIGAVLENLISNMVDNPINALLSANYIGILVWAVLLGFGLRNAKDHVKDVISSLADALTSIVKWVIQLAPLGIMGLVHTAIADNGLSALADYGRLLLVLVGTMALVALVINPLIAFIMLKRNPYPLTLRCLRESGITAFFTRSSAANIPVNMALCEALDLDRETYAVSIPLGATINMAGAAITISVLTLAAVHTLGIQVDFLTALLLSLLAAVSACGASGVAGGSLLLIPLATSLFGISADVAMQVVGVGFIIGVIQDSCETALNSSTDVLFTAVADLRATQKFSDDLIQLDQERSA